MAYDSNFYLDLAAVSRRSADKIVPLLLDAIQPTSVIDVGCGAGTWMAAWMAAGIDDIEGVDGSRAPDEALQASREGIRTVVDLSRSVPADRMFDLAITLEVAEHLPEERAVEFVRNLTVLAPVVVFSAAIPLQGGTGHINEQWQSWWADLFAVHGYRPSVALRSHYWNDDDVAAYYAQNLVIYASEEAAGRLPTLYPTAPSGPEPVLDVVHPRLWSKRVGHPFVGWLGGKLPERMKNAATSRLRPRVKFLSRP